MVEDSAEEQNSDLIAGLEEGDITPNFYEGGFKTWECSIDLAELVASEGIGFEDRHIIEVSAFPSCFLELGTYLDDGPVLTTIIAWLGNCGSITGVIRSASLSNRSRLGCGIGKKENALHICGLQLCCSSSSHPAQPCSNLEPFCQAPQFHCVV